MNEMQMIEKRISNRRYTDREISESILDEIRKMIDEYNAKTGLAMQLVVNDPAPFEGKAAAMFKGVRHYIALIGKKEDPNRQENEGYYGEKLVLQLTDMGLGTCWAASSFDQRVAKITLTEDEEVDLAIAFGYAKPKLSIKEKMMRKVFGKNAKTKEQIASNLAAAPAWYSTGADAVLKAPTTKNTYPFALSFENETASIRTDGGNERVMVDLGIAKLHFEIGAGGGSWEMGSPAAFRKE